MLNQTQISARTRALEADAQTAYADFRAGKINQKKFDFIMDACEREQAKLKAAMQARAKALSYVSCGEPNPYGGHPDPAGGGHQTPAFTREGATSKIAQPKNAFYCSPLQATTAQFKSLFDAAESFSGAAPLGSSISLKAPGFLDEGLMRASRSVGLKTAPNFTVEGATGSLLPPQLVPSAFPIMYDPSDIWQYLPGMPMDSQAITFLQHGTNTNPAAVTAEVTALPDLGMQMTPKTATAQKIGSTAAFSRELLDDFADFMGFVPSEMGRASTDARNNFIINDPSQGILSAAGILTRNANTSPTAIDSILAGINDLRVGTSFATCDLILCHPTTFLDIRTTRTTTGAYVLDQWQPMETLGEQDCDHFFGVRVVQSVKVPPSTAILMDTNKACIAFTRQGLEVAVNWMGDAVFATYAYQWRILERIALGIVRPAAVCVVTALPSYPGGNS